MGLRGLLHRLNIKFVLSLNPMLNRSIENGLKYHFLEMNNYLRLLREHPERTREVIGDSIEDYLENHLPTLYAYFREYFPPKVTDRFERKYQELKEAYEREAPSQF